MNDFEANLEIRRTWYDTIAKLENWEKTAGIISIISLMVFTPLVLTEGGAELFKVFALLACVLSLCTMSGLIAAVSIPMSKWYR